MHSVPTVRTMREIQGMRLAQRDFKASHEPMPQLELFTTADQRNPWNIHTLPLSDTAKHLTLLYDL